MKVEVRNLFKPVTIVLENQDEINKMFAIASFSPIDDAVGLEELWNKLKDHSTDGWERYYVMLQRM